MKKIRGAFPLKRGLKQKIKKERINATKLEISVPEVVNIFKEIKEQPEQLYEMIRVIERRKIFLNDKD